MTTRIGPLAGKLAPHSSLIDVAKLTTAYYSEVPEAAVAAQRVSFGTSGHRGSGLDLSFNEWHVLATTQAICNQIYAESFTSLAHLQDLLIEAQAMIDTVVSQERP